MQWVDDGSRALLHYLVRAAESGGQALAVVIALRSSHSPSYAESLGAVITSSTRRLGMELGPLDRAAGIAVVTELAPQLSPQAAAALWQRSGGSPFWLEVLASSDPGVADVGALVRHRMAGAGVDAVFLLAALALAGRPIAVEDIVDVCGWSVRHAEAVAAELVALGMGARTAGAIRSAMT